MDFFSIRISLKFVTNWQQGSIGLGNGLAPDKPFTEQMLIQFNDVYMRH